MLEIFDQFIQSILPPGTVKDENTFFILVSILVGLIIVAFILRRRRGT